jgi:outer membrane protein TolC
MFKPSFFIAFAALIIVFSVRGAAFAGEATAIEQYGAKDQLPVIALTLDETINIALLNNRNIINSQYSAESQRYSIDAAKALFDLKLIPAGSINLSGGNDSDYSYTSIGLQLQKKMEYGTTVAVGPQISHWSWESSKEYTTDMGVTITQPLMRGFGKDVTMDSVQSADAAYKTSLRNIYQTKVNTVLETISIYYEVIRQMEMLHLYEKMAERLEGHAEIARAKEKVGVSTPMDTYRAEIPLKEAQDGIITASQSFQDAKDRLKLILALPQNIEIELAVPEVPCFQELSLDDTTDTALKKRIEIEQMNQDLAEAQRKAAIMKHNILPDLNLVLGYGRYDTSDTMEKSAGFDLDRYSLSLQAGTDIFRTAERAAYQQSLLNIKSLGINIESRKEDIRRQVRKQWLSLREAVRRINIRESQIKQGEEKIALAEVKFAHQMADNFDVIEAEKELQSARSNLLAAKIEYALGIYNMKAVMGLLVPRD